VAFRFAARKLRKINEPLTSILSPEEGERKFEDSSPFLFPLPSGERVRVRGLLNGQQKTPGQ
jgi:hypothetical protein